MKIKSFLNCYECCKKYKGKWAILKPHSMPLLYRVHFQDFAIMYQYINGNNEINCNFSGKYILLHHESNQP